MSERKAFTLVEIMLAIALIVCATGLIAGFVPTSENAFKKRPPDKALLGAIRRGRIEALERGREIYLKIDTASVVLGDWETKREILRSELSSGNAELTEIVFEPLRPENVSEFILTGVSEEAPLDVLRFNPDGSMSPVKIIFKNADSTSEIKIDTFSGAPLKEAEE